MLSGHPNLCSAKGRRFFDQKIFRLCLQLSNICTAPQIVLVPGPKKWLILGVSLSHLVESRDLFFLEAEIVDNIIQQDVLKSVRQIGSYDDMFRS